MQCECCSNESDNLHSYKTMKMCDDCFEKEKKLEIESKNSAEERIQTIKEKAAVMLSTRDEYWNAEGTDLALISGTVFERATAIKERLENWSKTLFEIKTKESRCHSELMSLVNKLTQEELAKLKINAPNYDVKPVLVKKPRTKEKMSKDDRTLLNMATIIFSKKLAQLPAVISKCGKEHADWFEPVTRELKHQFKNDYNQYVLDNGAMTEQQAIDKMKETVKAGKNRAFQETAEGKRNIDGSLKQQS